LSKENTKHHLFDNLDGEGEGVIGGGGKVEKDFTEDDLVADDNNKNEWEYKVRSSPRKASTKDSNIDPNNPYMNKNIDADLGMVIGKHRANRKQINAQFLIDNSSNKNKDNDKEKSDR